MMIFQVCQQLHLCSLPPETTSMEVTRPNPIIQCLFCKEVIKEVEAMTGDDQDEAKIRIALGKVCSHMPRATKNRCKKYVSKYSDEIVGLLVQKLPPKEVKTQVRIKNKRLILSHF